MAETIANTPSGGNVFADIGLSRPDDLRAQADLTFDIYSEIERQGLGARAVSELLSVGEAQARRLAEAKPSTCSVPCLREYLQVLQSYGILDV